MPNLGRRLERKARCRAEARRYDGKEEATENRTENKNAPSRAGAQISTTKSVLQQQSIVKENLQKKWNRRKPLNCWEIAEVTLDVSFSKEKVLTQDPPS